MERGYNGNPFFTSKKPMGIGVGLSICNGIIKDHKGVITAGNTPQGGAVFTIQLPIPPGKEPRPQASAS